MPWTANQHMTALWLTLVAAAYLASFLLLVARRRPGYSHIRHTISELGEFGAPERRLVSLRGFLPVGVLLLLVAYLLRPLHQPEGMLALCIAIGYLVAAAFPCDPGSPLSGSFRQAVHNLGGAVEYAGGAIALMRLSETFGQPFRLAGIIVGAAIIGLSFSGAMRGIIQRVAEVCLFGGLAFAVWVSRAAVQPS